MSGPVAAPGLNGQSVFLSASIPSTELWDGDFDPLEITSAVVACARGVLSAGARIVTAAHPTIAPLLWYTAAESGPQTEAAVVIYQSEVFSSVLPDATRWFEADSVARVVRVPAASGEAEPDPRRSPQSLATLRSTMLRSEAPVAAMFIGGMTGIRTEFDLFRELRPGSPTFAFGAPGGVASELALYSPPNLRHKLATSRVYPTLVRSILRDIRGTMEGP